MEKIEQNQNVSVYLIGRSRGRNTVSITVLEDGWFDVSVSYHGVGGRICAEKMVSVKRWLKCRLQLMGGGCAALKPVSGKDVLELSENGFF